MNQIEKMYLADTIALLNRYDGEHQVDDLKAIIDETKERLVKIINGKLVKEDLGSDEKEVLADNNNKYKLDDILKKCNDDKRHEEMITDTRGKELL